MCKLGKYMVFFHFVLLKTKISIQKLYVLNIIPNINLNISVLDMSLKALEDTHQKQHIPLIHKSIWLGISGSP